MQMESQPRLNKTCPDNPDFVPLEWYNVATASVFIMVTGALSIALGLQLEKSLFIAAVRCLVQLTIMGLVLKDVFGTRNPVFVFGLALMLILLGTNEIVYNKCRKRYSGMFLSSFFSLGASTMVVGILGTKLAMEEDPFWEPYKFIPTMGMLIGNTMSGIAVGLSFTLNQLSEQREKIETYLSFGATRWEATRPIATEAVRLAMLPTINMMSVIGLISIPGMMTGQIIGGAPIMDAVKYQQIIVFMISASAALGVLSAVFIAAFICVDASHRLRVELITTDMPWIYEQIRWLGRIIKGFFMRIRTTFWYCCCHCCQRQNLNDNEENENMLNQH
ncbi:142_t:CDS:10 [Paraglomus occultum]|uniref:142_t:CDS:1 n=1 Tax=Paraglomus occultum TaxID=144539 RepID=A0A9N9GCM3_9GLOM|nr:142_t:CDS:10 [Paraglomus occultum]